MSDVHFAGSSILKLKHFVSRSRLHTHIHTHPTHTHTTHTTHTHTTHTPHTHHTHHTHTHHTHTHTLIRMSSWTVEEMLHKQEPCINTIFVPYLTYFITLNPTSIVYHFNYHQQMHAVTTPC